MLDTNQNQFQHYVPRFYLSGWQTTVRHKPKRVWVYERDRDSYHAAIKKIGGSVNFYAIQKRDGATDIETVERLLGVIEGNTGKIIPKIKNGDSLNATERWHFAEFLSLLARRTPFAKAKSEGLVPKLLPNIIEPLLERANGIAEPDRRNRAVENITRVASEAISNAGSVASAVLLQPSDIATVIEKMDWAFFHSPKVPFLTSDNPFVYSLGIGIGNYENGHIIFPITKEISFQARNSTDFKSDYYDIPEENAKDINMRIIRHAYTQVYASEQSEELEKLVRTNLGSDLNSVDKNH